MNKKLITAFMDLAFNLENIRAKELLKKMRDMDEDSISIQDYCKRVLKELPKNKAEALFVSFSVGSLYGEYKTQKAYNEN